MQYTLKSLWYRVNVSHACRDIDHESRDVAHDRSRTRNDFGAASAPAAS